MTISFPRKLILFQCFRIAFQFKILYVFDKVLSTNISKVKNWIGFERSGRKAESNMFSFKAGFNLRFSNTASRRSIIQDKYKSAEYLFTSAGTWGWLHRRRQPGSQGLVALDECFVAPRLRQLLVQVPRLLRGQPQRKHPGKIKMRKRPIKWEHRKWCLSLFICSQGQIRTKDWPNNTSPWTSEYKGRCQYLRWIVPSSDKTQLLLLGKFEYTGGPIFKVVLEC